MAPTTATGSSTRSTIRTRSTQKLPSRSVAWRAKPRTSAAATAMPDRGGDEVLHRQPGRLHQVAHRRLTRVGLPVGVGDEADRGVPRLVGRHRGEPERQPQVVLQPLQPVEQQHRHRARTPARCARTPPRTARRPGPPRPAGRCPAPPGSAGSGSAPGTGSRRPAGTPPPAPAISEATNSTPAAVALIAGRHDHAGDHLRTAPGSSRATTRYPTSTTASTAADQIHPAHRDHPTLGARASHLVPGPPASIDRVTAAPPPCTTRPSTTNSTTVSSTNTRSDTANPSKQIAAADLGRGPQ